MVASLAAIFANLWDPQLKQQTPKCKTNAQMSTCRKCEHSVRALSMGIECEICNRGFHENVSESVTQKLIAWKTSSDRVHSAVKMIWLTLIISPKPKFFNEMSMIL